MIAQDFSRVSVLGAFSRGARGGTPRKKTAARGGTQSCPTLDEPEARSLDDHSEDDRDAADRTAPHGGVDQGLSRRQRGGGLQATGPGRRVRVRAPDADEIGGQLCGPAACEVLRRQYEVFGDQRYERLSRLSASRLYNLRRSKTYRARRTTVNHTRPTAVPVGEKRRADPGGKPGFARVDTVHQGDRDRDELFRAIGRAVPAVAQGGRVDPSPARPFALGGAAPERATLREKTVCTRAVFLLGESPFRGACTPVRNVIFPGPRQPSSFGATRPDRLPKLSSTLPCSGSSSHWKTLPQPCPMLSGGERGG